MEAVDKRWYIGYGWWININALIAVTLSLCAIFFPSMKFLSEDWGMDILTLVIATFAVFFRLFSYRYFENQVGLNFAAFLYSLIQLACIIHLLSVTGWAHSLYVPIIMIMFFFTGTNGIFTIIGATLLSSMYLIVVIPSLAKDDSFDWFSLGIIALSYLMCLLSYFTWRNKYIDQESQQISLLNNMLKNKQQQSEILIGSIADGVIVTDTKGKISLMNPSAAAMTQWPIDEASNIDVRTVLKLTQEDGKPLESDENIFAQVFAQRKNFSKTLGLLGRDGKKSIVSLVISPVKLPQGEELLGAVAVIRDVGAERQIEKQRADFISTASHEMRTPVAAIEGYLALALNPNVSKIDNKAKEYLEKAHSSTQHLGKLFQDLLTSAKAEDGRLTSHPVVVEMGEFIEQLAEDLRFSAEKKGLSVEFIINSGAPDGEVIDTSKELKQVRPLYYSNVDPDRIREVVTNIFDNAVKYTPEGKVALGLTGNDEVVQIHVSDTGPGIPPEDIPHLFQKFYRVDNTATRTIGGTGLGLFICKKIVELYNGSIWAESTVGKGSTFYINLPRLTTAKASQLKLTVEKDQLVSDKA
ncbi:PAS domain-containing protein [Candidatus Saccharibacteria bacterium]|nr:PAS domain-containing protein [Candidatus Saccharibacteria bacterium]